MGSRRESLNVMMQNVYKIWKPDSSAFLGVHQGTWDFRKSRNHESRKTCLQTPGNPFPQPSFWFHFIMLQAFMVAEMLWLAAGKGRLFSELVLPPTACSLAKPHSSKQNVQGLSFACLSRTGLFVRTLQQSGGNGCRDSSLVCRVENSFGMGYSDEKIF